VRSLRSIRPGSVTIARKSAIAGTLLFSPVIGLMTALPWFFTPTSPYGTLLTTVTGVGWLSGVAWLAVRQRRIEIAVSPAAELVLEESTEGDDPAYRVVLEDRGRTEVVLEHSDPARALKELRRLRDELGIPVRPGWGLSATALNCSPDEVPARLVPADVSGPRWQAQGRTALASCLGSLFILAVTAFTFSRVIAPASLLARVLPLVFALLIGLVGVALLVLRLRVRITESGLRVDTTLLSLSLKELELPAHAIARADAVGSRENRPQHVLIQTIEGPRAIPLSGVAAHAVARAIVAAPRRPGNSGVSWARPIRDHQSSLEENPC
jgi:hypothetical protein